MNKKFLYFISVMGIFVFFVFLYLTSNISDSFDNKLRDDMFLLRGDINTTNSVSIVDIDEKSLKELGQWPWSRDKMAKILTNLTNAGALIIGLDIFFPEIDTKSPAYLAKKYNLKVSLKDTDKILANTLSQTPTILGYLMNFEDNLTKGILPNVPAIFIQKNFKQEYLFQSKGYIANVPVLQNNAYSGGFVNMIPDLDGVVREVPLLIKYDGLVYPSLAFEMFRIASGVRKVMINYSSIGITSVNLGKYRIDTDRFGRLFINYRGDKGKFPYISASDIYHNKFDKSLVKDKFILVGTSAVGLFDLRVTPFNTVYPGVEVHANIIDNLLKGDFLYKPDIAVTINLLALLLIAIMAGIIFYFFGALTSAILLVGVVVSYFSFVYYLMFHYGYIINIILPIVEVILLSIVLIAINYLMEQKKSKALKTAFSKKVSPKVMDELLDNTSGAILAPREKEITIFFSDIRNFTSISEKLGSPHKVIELLNIYMTPVVENIVEHKGTVDKFIGDAIMAYWNAPTDIENHADESVSSAIEQIKLLKSLNIEIKKRFSIIIEIGIGINTGNATIGEMGSEGRADYTIIGDDVNLASRLEGLNKIYHTNILISENTYKLLTKKYKIKDIDLVRVKGKTKPVKIYQVIDFGYEEFKEHDNGLKLYRNAHFKEALEIFKALYNETKEELYNLYIERCNYFIDNPPTDFDGVWTFTTK